MKKFGAKLILILILGPGGTSLASAPADDAIDFDEPRWSGWETSGVVYGLLGYGPGMGYEFESLTRQVWFDSGFRSSGSASPLSADGEVLYEIGYTPGALRFSLGAGLDYNRYKEDTIGLESFRNKTREVQFAGALAEAGVSWEGFNTNVGLYTRTGAQGSGGGLRLGYNKILSRDWEAMVSLDYYYLQKTGAGLEGYVGALYYMSPLYRLGLGAFFSGSDVGVGLVFMGGFEM